MGWFNHQLVVDFVEMSYLEKCLLTKNDKIFLLALRLGTGGGGFVKWLHRYVFCGEGPLQEINSWMNGVKCSVFCHLFRWLWCMSSLICHVLFPSRFKSRTNKIHHTRSKVHLLEWFGHFDSPTSILLSFNQFKLPTKKSPEEWTNRNRVCKRLCIYIYILFIYAYDCLAFMYLLWVLFDTVLMVQKSGFHQLRFVYSSLSHVLNMFFLHPNGGWPWDFLNHQQVSTVRDNPRSPTWKITNMFVG